MRRAAKILAALLPRSHRAAPCEFAGAGSTGDDPGSFHFDHAFDLRQGAHHRLQLRKVGTREGEDVAGAPVVPRAAVGLADVDLLRAECLSNVREDAWSVQGGALELDGPIDLGVRLP